MTTPLVQKIIAERDRVKSSEYLGPDHYSNSYAHDEATRALLTEAAEALAGRDGCGACGGNQAAQCGTTGCRVEQESPDADSLPKPWALYVGTHEDEYGKVTAMVEVFGEHGGLKQPLFTADQMRSYKATPSRAGGGEVGDGWLPIETAPKHVDVLVWREDCGAFIAKLTTPDAVIPDGQLEEMEFPDNFEEWWSDAYGWQEGSEKPTHWQHKPNGPAARHGAGARGGSDG